MSSARQQPEFFFDRGLGKTTAERLRALGWVIHLIADHYPNDAQEIEDDAWIAEGCANGWSLLSKDKKIRYRGRELAALHDGRLFCLSNGNLVIDEMVARFEAARLTIERHALDSAQPGFWQVNEGGRVVRKWP